MTRLVLFLWCGAAARSNTELRHAAWLRESGEVTASGDGDGDDAKKEETPPLASSMPLNPDCSKCVAGSTRNCCLPLPPSEMPSPKCSVTLPETLKSHPKWPTTVLATETWNTYITYNCQIPDGDKGIRGASGVTCDPCWLTGTDLKDTGMLYCEQPTVPPPATVTKTTKNNETGEMETEIVNSTTEEHVVCYNATPQGARFVCNAGDEQLDIYGGWTIGEGAWLPLGVPRHQQTLQIVPNCPPAEQDAQDAKDEAYLARLKNAKSIVAARAEKKLLVGNVNDAKERSKDTRLAAGKANTTAVADTKANTTAGASLLEFADSRRRPAPIA